MTRLYAEDLYKNGPNYYTVSCVVEGMCQDGTWFGDHDSWFFFFKEDANAFADALKRREARFTAHARDDERISVRIHTSQLLVKETVNG